MKAANREWNKPKREKFVSTNDTERNWRPEECFDIDIEMQCLKFALLVFNHSIFSVCFFPLLFGMGMYPLPLYVRSM